LPTPRSSSSANADDKPSARVVVDYLIAALHETERPYRRG
jgi:hypothetical protein